MFFMEIRLCRPEEEEASWELEEEVWAAFNKEAEGATGSEYFHRLHLLAIEGDRIVGTIDACPFRWSGDPDDLSGWREMVLGSYQFPVDYVPEGSDMWAGAIGTSIDPKAGSRGLSRQLLLALRERALQEGYRGVVAPVRPIWRARVPGISIEDYADLRLPDGRHFDPWVRTHEAIGGQIVAARDNSASFEGTRQQWEGWSGMNLADEGDFLIPGAIDFLQMRNGWGTLREPSIWIVHSSDE